VQSAVGRLHERGARRTAGRHQCPAAAPALRERRRLRLGEAEYVDERFASARRTSLLGITRRATVQSHSIGSLSGTRSARRHAVRNTSATTSSALPASVRRTAARRPKRRSEGAARTVKC
jgi:hypothetical protein